MSPVAAPARTRWSAVLLGAVSGLFATLIISLVAYILTALIYRTGRVPENLSGWIGLALSLLAGQFLAGYVGGAPVTQSLCGGPRGGWPPSVATPSSRLSACWGAARPGSQPCFFSGRRRWR